MRSVSVVQHQAIADPVLRQDVAGCARIRFDLVPELPHIHVQVVDPFCEMSPPDVLQQGAGRTDPSGIQVKKFEQTVFRRAEKLLLAAESNDLATRATSFFYSAIPDERPGTKQLLFYVTKNKSGCLTLSICTTTTE